MKTLLIAGLMVLFAMPGYAEMSIAGKIAAIDSNAGYDSNATRIHSLVSQIMDRFNMTEIEVADKSVTAVLTLLKEKYGINQSIQGTLEEINKVKFVSQKNSGDFSKVLVVYTMMRNSGQDGSEAVKRINNALALDNMALDMFLNQ